MRRRWCASSCRRTRSMRCARPPTGCACVSPAGRSSSPKGGWCARSRRATSTCRAARSPWKAAGRSPPTRAMPRDRRRSSGCSSSTWRSPARRSSACSGSAPTCASSTAASRLPAAGTATCAGSSSRTSVSRSSVLVDAAELAPGRPYGERSEAQPAWHDRAAEFLYEAGVRPLADRLRDPARALRAILPPVAAHEAKLRALADSELRTLAGALRGRFRRHGFTAQLSGECFALVREAAARAVGKRHFDSQLLAGWALLQGKLVEMETGEGKTFAATLAASAMALAGYPVHVITVNDYLAARDAEEMGPLYR